jgi:16S rRNA (guanine527-N7)-methyltransferase
MTPRDFEEFLLNFNVSRESRLRLETYVQLLLTWQAKINLIGPSTVDDIWRRHIADGLQLRSLMEGGTRIVADLGSGAGVPGLVLALGYGLRTHLYESNGKKVAFLREVIRQTKIDATVHQVRLETLEQHLPEALPHYVTARALAPLAKLLLLSEPLLSRGATGLFHKGQDVDSELTEATKIWKIGALVRHPSLTDSKGTILEVKEISRV